MAGGAAELCLRAQIESPTFTRIALHRRYPSQVICFLDLEDARLNVRFCQQPVRPMYLVLDEASEVPGQLPYAHFVGEHVEENGRGNLPTPRVNLVFLHIDTCAIGRVGVYPLTPQFPSGHPDIRDSLDRDEFWALQAFHSEGFRKISRNGRIY